jgi:hypothetical protein
MCNYFDLLKEPVLDILKAYKQDFLEEDKRLLEGFAGSFILGVRDSGTNQLQYTESSILSAGLPIMGDGLPSLENYRANVETFLFSNDVFFVGESGNVRRCSKEHAFSVYRSWDLLAVETFKKYLEKKAA